VRKDAKGRRPTSGLTRRQAQQTEPRQRKKTRRTVHSKINLPNVLEQLRRQFFIEFDGHYTYFLLLLSYIGCVRALPASFFSSAGG